MEVMSSSYPYGQPIDRINRSTLTKLTKVTSVSMKSGIRQFFFRIVVMIETLGACCFLTQSSQLMHLSYFAASGLDCLGKLQC